MNRKIQVSPSQYQKLRKYPRHRGVWRALNVQLSDNTQVHTGNGGVRLVRTGGTRQGS